MTYPEFESIYKTHKERVYSYSKYKLRGNHHDAEDTVSYVFMKLWETQPDANTSIPILTWLLFVAYRRTIDILRIKYRYYIEINEDIALPDSTSVNFIYNNIQLKEINHLVDKLPPKYKLVFSLHYFNEMSPSEIHKEIGGSYQTIRNELCIIRNKLRKSILDGNKKGPMKTKARRTTAYENIE